ncbi:MAG: hypothetical protein ACR2PS_14335, partial [Pseudomonadales bacterium]
MSKKDLPILNSVFSAANNRGNAQMGNLRFLEKALHEHWKLGQNIILCWTPTDIGIEILVVPHYFLGSFSASLNDEDTSGSFTEANGRFIRQLISNRRLMALREFNAAADQLKVPKTVIKLPIPLTDDIIVLNKIDEIVIRHSISFVAKRAVLLIDIVDFSLFTPFEQTSQLTSLSYSLNSAHNKMLKKNIDINFARTTTGDGFYIWNRDRSALSTMHLYQFMLLVIADNAIAKGKSRGNTVPVVRSGFHVGSHYEFYQAEGLNPSMSSYIVGDVTIELARMLDMAQAGQIFIGDFIAELPTSDREGAYMIEVDSKKFVERATKYLSNLKGIELSGEEIVSIHSYLTGETGASAGQILRRFKITDKHGRSRYAFNLRSNIHIKNSKPIILGLQDYYLPKSSRSRRHSLDPATTTTT